MTEATLVARPEGDGWVRLSFAGEMDLANAAELEAQIHGAIDNQVKGVVVDLTEVSYIDSVGVRILVTLASRLEQLRIALRIVAPSGSLAHRVVEITGLQALASDPV